MCNFGRGHNELQFCEIILNLDQRFRRRCCIKDFLSGALATPLISKSRPFCTILVEGIMKSISRKFF